MQEASEVAQSSGLPPSSEKTGSPWKSLAPLDQSKKPAPREDPGLEKMKREMDIQAAQRKKEEALTQASFTVTIDKDKVAKIEIPKPQEVSSYEKKDVEVQQVRLQELLDHVMRLPDKLAFQPGITLIVGENGSGKSTLAKALYLAAQFKDRLNNGYDTEEAKHFVFDLNMNMPGLRAWLNQAGLAPQLGQAMEADSLETGKRIGGDDSPYRDFTEIMGSQKRNEEDYVFYRQSEGDLINGWSTHQSHRQTVDRLVFEQMERDKKFNPKPGVFFFDEPETGMSPRRQKQLEKEILDAVTNGSIVIVPTNSVVLFDSDLPRIDLDFPERGIHRPSEYLAKT